MNERLTDEQVAELATCNATYIHPDDLKSIAREVQQARRRRCENCAHWTSFHDFGVSLGVCTMIPCNPKADWFCAGFKAKP
jgi:hypothetical protein